MSLRNRQSMSLSFTINRINELQQVAAKIAELTTNYSHFCFDAPMGAGKTTLIKSICEQLGVIDNISSPTYAIVNEYQTKREKPIYHFDLYRLNDEIELLDIGIEDILDSNAICFFEWPEKILNFLPSDYVKVSIDVKNEVREIAVTVLKVEE